MEPMDSDAATAEREQGCSVLAQAVLTRVASVCSVLVWAFVATLALSSPTAAQTNGGTVISLEHQATESEKPAATPTTASAQPTPSPQPEAPVVNTVAPPPAPPTPLQPIAPEQPTTIPQTQGVQTPPVQSATPVTSPASPSAEDSGTGMMVVLVIAAIVVVVVLGVVILVLMRKKPAAPMVSGAAQAAFSVEESLSTPERPKASLVDPAQVTGRASIEINADIVVIGRSRQNADVGQQAVVLPVRTVGRRHAAIEYRNHTYMLVDQGSVNGTFLNNRQITAPTVLHDGDVIRLESAELTFSLPVERESERTMMAPSEPEPTPREQPSGGKGLIEQMMERGGPDEDLVAAISPAPTDDIDEPAGEIDQDQALTETPELGSAIAPPNAPPELDGGITVAPEVQVIRDRQAEQDSNPQSGDWSLNSGVTVAPDFEVLRNAKEQSAADEAPDTQDEPPSSHTMADDFPHSGATADNFDAAQLETEDERIGSMRSEDTEPDAVAGGPAPSSEEPVPSGANQPQEASSHASGPSEPDPRADDTVDEMMSPTAEPQDASVSGPPPVMDSDIEAIFIAEAQDLSGEQTSPRDAEVSKETIFEPSQSFTGAVTESQPTPEDEFGPTSAELAAITSEGNVDLDLGFDEPRASQPAVEPEPAVPLIGRPRAWLHDLDNSTRTPSFEIIHERINVGRSAPSGDQTGNQSDVETEYLVIRRKTIGRKHAAVGFEDGGFYVEDLKSVNGTYVNGERAVGRMKVANGDEVAFDEFRFRFVIEVSRPEPSPPPSDEAPGDDDKTHIMGS